MKLVSVAEMQAIEREADLAGLTYPEMMENAGRRLAEIVEERYGQIKSGGVLGLVGPGNNGGDTLVALAYLASSGWPATAYLVRPRPEKDPLVERLQSLEGKIIPGYAEDLDFQQLKTLIGAHALLLDGVLGTGSHPPLKPEVAQPLECARRELAALTRPPQVVAVDCPSGVDCDSGDAPAEALPASLTVTMAAIKTGLLDFPAYTLAGEIRLAGIGLPEDGAGLPTWLSLQRSVVEAEEVRGLLPPRPLDAHKGTFGTVMVVAGSSNYSGAALLAGEAAYRSGAGLVTLAVPASLHPALAGRLVEATWLLLPHDTGVIAAEADAVVRQGLERVTALLIGPGFGLENTTREFIARLLGGPASGRAGIGFVHPPASEAHPPAGLPPLVIDADGLNLLARLHNWPTLLPPRTVLTPHPGEMSVLTGLPKEEIQLNRLAVAERFSREWHCIVVLKGAFTVIASPEGPTAVIPVATPALARAGTGDVLAGLITGLMAQGLQSFPAAVAGAWIHAQAGLAAAGKMGGSAAVLAGDVLASVPQVLAQLGQ